jgi:hypothetical protein
LLPSTPREILYKLNLDLSQVYWTIIASCNIDMQPIASVHMIRCNLGTNGYPTTLLTTKAAHWIGHWRCLSRLALWRSSATAQWYLLLHCNVWTYGSNKLVYNLKARSARPSGEVLSGSRQIGGQSESKGKLVRPWLYSLRDLLQSDLVGVEASLVAPFVSKGIAELVVLYLHALYAFQRYLKRIAPADRSIELEYDLSSQGFACLSNGSCKDGEREGNSSSSSNK